MRFLTDENVAKSVVVVLRNSGHDVFDVKESSRQGVADRDLILLARRERRIIVTHDKDFLLTHEVKVLFLRFRDQRPKNVMKHLIMFLQSQTLKKFQKVQFVIISEQAVEFISR